MHSHPTGHLTGQSTSQPSSQTADSPSQGQHVSADEFDDDDIFNEEDAPAVATAEHPYAALSPSVVLEAIESCGFETDGRVLTLNSYENRVFQVGIEGEEPIIAKFYRPERWSAEQIREEHEFATELVSHDLPVVAPMEFDGDTLHQRAGFNLGIYDRRGGHAPELDDLDTLAVMGRVLGRMHAVGSVRSFEHRPVLDAQSFGHDSVDFVLDHFIPDDELADDYDEITCALLNEIDDRLEAMPPKLIRVHGDCHVGNVLWRDDNPNFVDLDDARMAPAVQDLWMLLCGTRDRQQAQIQVILDNYRQFAPFNNAELKLVEVYRTLRMLQYAAWLARRWGDPAFPAAFPWFGDRGYWRQHIGDLREQWQALQKPSLAAY